jgi:hypothetical protein
MGDPFCPAISLCLLEGPVPCRPGQTATNVNPDGSKDNYENNGNLNAREVFPWEMPGFCSGGDSLVGDGLSA